MKDLIVKNRSTLIVVGIAVIILALFIYTFMRPNLVDTQAPTNAEVEIKLGEDAPNKMVVYLDPLCDRCHQFHEDVITELNNEEVKNGELEITIRPLSIFSIESSTVNEIALCAHDQGKYLEASSLLGKKLHEENIEVAITDRVKKLLNSEPAELVADELDLDQSELEDCMSDNINRSKLTRQDDAAKKEGIYSTPTIFINNHDPVRGYSQIGYVRNLINM